VVGLAHAEDALHLLDGAVRAGRNAVTKTWSWRFNRARCGRFPAAPIVVSDPPSRTRSTAIFAGPGELRKFLQSLTLV